LFLYCINIIMNLTERNPDMKKEFFEFCNCCAVQYKSVTDFRIFRFGSVVTIEEIFHEKLWNRFDSIEHLKYVIQYEIGKRQC